MGSLEINFICDIVVRIGFVIYLIGATKCVQEIRHEMLDMFFRLHKAELQIEVLQNKLEVKENERKKSEKNRVT